MRKIIMMVILATIFIFTAGCADFTREITPNRDMTMDMSITATSEIPMMVQEIQTDFDLEGECITLDNGINCKSKNMIFINDDEQSQGYWGKSSYTKVKGFWKNTYRIEINVSEITNKDMLEATDYGMSAKTTVNPFGKVTDTNMRKLNLDGKTQYIINMLEPDNYYIEFKDWRFKFW